MGKVTVDSAKLRRALTNIAEAASERAAKNLRAKIREEIIMSGRIDTGEMMERIDVDHAVPHGPNQRRWAVRPKTKQFRFQDRGTRGTPYRPGQVLRFKPKGSGVYIFRKSSGPISAAHFLKKAQARMSAKDWGE